MAFRLVEKKPELFNFCVMCILNPWRTKVFDFFTPRVLSVTWRRRRRRRGRKVVTESFSPGGTIATVKKKKRRRQFLTGGEKNTHKILFPMRVVFFFFFFSFIPSFRTFRKQNGSLNQQIRVPFLK